MSNIEVLRRIIAESNVSDRQYAELDTVIKQIEVYATFKASRGDLFAQNLVDQLQGGPDGATSRV
jgi:hypothetical protein